MKKKTLIIYTIIFLVVTIFIVIAILGGYSVLNKFFPKANPIKYPIIENIQSVSLLGNNGNTVVLNQTDFEELLLNISNSQPTRRIGMNDYPAIKPYYTIIMQTSEREYCYYVYEEGSQVYIELPYDGIYRTNNQIIDFILKHYVEEQPIDSNPIEIVKEIESITHNSNGTELLNILEPFFEDECYIYRFSNPISQYVIVKYTDGSTENVKEALENGHIQITDLDKYSINYSSEPKLIEDIIYHSDRGGEPDALECFYSDGTYSYSFPSIRSSVVIVYYKDGTEQTVKDALAEGKIKISDLDWFGIQYYKDPIE